MRRQWLSVVLVAALPGVKSVQAMTFPFAAVFRAFANRIGAFPDPALPIVPVVSMMIVLVVANLVAVMPTRRAQRRSTAQLLQVD